MNEQTTPKWGLFTNQAIVMAYVCQHNDSTVREISDAIGITERSTLAMLGDLHEAGIIVRHRVGRSNTYAIDFARLATFRRGNAGPPTPASFADGLIRTLLELSGDAPASMPHPRRPDAETLAESTHARWGFFTNHLRTLLSVANAPGPTAQEIAQSVGITERAAVGILRQLEEEGMLQRSKEGRRNSYRLDFAALERFPRWSPGSWPLQQEIIDVTVDGFRQLEGASSGSRSGASSRFAAATH